jgi:hypothetical protein
MRQRLRTCNGKAHYAKRKSTVETVFGLIKQVQEGFRQFLLRGLRAVQGELDAGVYRLEFEAPFCTQCLNKMTRSYRFATICVEMGRRRPNRRLFPATPSRLGRARALSRPPQESRFDDQNGAGGFVQHALGGVAQQRSLPSGSAVPIGDDHVRPLTLMRGSR